MPVPPYDPIGKPVRRKRNRKLYDDSEISKGKAVRFRSLAAILRAKLDYCQMPGCNSRGPYHVRHIKSRGSGGGDVPQNLVNLCVECHDKVHRGLIHHSKA